MIFKQPVLPPPPNKKLSAPAQRDEAARLIRAMQQLFNKPVNG